MTDSVITTKMGALTSLINDFIEKKTKINVDIGEEQWSGQLVSFGSPFVDWATGGVPRGVLTEISGDEGTGKSTMAMVAAGNAQRDQNAFVLWFDIEGTFKYQYATAFGLDTSKDNFEKYKPTSSEDTIDLVRTWFDQYGDAVKKLKDEETLAQVSRPIFIVIDSVAALTPLSELNKDKAGVGESGRLNSTLGRLLVARASEYGAYIVVINQLRDKIGGMPTFGATPKRITGGKFLRYAGFVQIRVKQRYPRLVAKIDTIQGEQETTVGTCIEITTTKNKATAPHKKAFMSILYGLRVWDAYTVVELGAVDGKDISPWLSKKKAMYYIHAHPDGLWPDVSMRGKSNAWREVGKYPELIKQVLQDMADYNQAARDLMTEDPIIEEALDDNDNGLDESAVSDTDDESVEDDEFATDDNNDLEGGEFDEDEDEEI